MREIPFENLDVVKYKHISMQIENVQEKLVAQHRGGYCFEHNTLLQYALLTLGFAVTPLLCRVRWNKAPNEQTTFTHIALKVVIDEVPYLVDVGFGGVGSIAPLRINTQDIQEIWGTIYRLQQNTGHDSSYSTLLCKSVITGEEKAMYMFRDEVAQRIDLELSNWWSCTHPTARFVTSFFVARIIGDERHYILNRDYVISSKEGSTIKSTLIDSLQELLVILEKIFSLKFEDSSHLDRYLK
jgi:N-hydroxyarylamine O-acetyltransferase